MDWFTRWLLKSLAGGVAVLAPLMFGLSGLGVSKGVYQLVVLAAYILVLLVAMLNYDRAKARHPGEPGLFGS